MTEDETYGSTSKSGRSIPQLCRRSEALDSAWIPTQTSVPNVHQEPHNLGRTLLDLATVLTTVEQITKKRGILKVGKYLYEQNFLKKFWYVILPFYSKIWLLCSLSPREIIWPALDQTETADQYFHQWQNSISVSNPILGKIWNNCSLQDFVCYSHPVWKVINESEQSSKYLGIQQIRHIMKEQMILQPIADCG